MDFFRPTHLKVHLNRLQSNFRFLKSLHSQDDFLCPMIKANAYGHGDIEVARALIAEGCDFLGVASVEEAVGLVESDISCDILVFGFYTQAAVQEISERQLTAVISNFDQLNWLKQTKKPLKIHLKFDSGMHRLGFQESDSEKINQWLSQAPDLEVVGYCTHLYEGSNLSIVGESSHQQVLSFERAIRTLPKVTYQHVYNSAAITSLKQAGSRFKFGSRPGLLTYGVDAGEGFSLKPLVSPTMELRSKVVALQKVKKGEIVSYGGTWQAPYDSLIGIVPAGYADGVSRSLSNKGEVLVCGQRAKIIGRVCMDYTMVDLTNLKTINQSFVGETVIFIGEQGDDQISIEEFANKAGRITYEVMTSIGSRVPRFYGY